jgi:hypothetical protein
VGGEPVKNLVRKHLTVMNNLAPETQAQACLCHGRIKVYC